MASRNEITDIAFNFVPIKRRTEFTMDMLIEGEKPMSVPVRLSLSLISVCFRRFPSNCTPLDQNSLFARTNEQD